MATHDIKLKKYVAGTTNAWEDAYPETTHTQIIATGTADSTTFLRGDGAWAVPAGSTTAGSAEKVTLQVRFGEAVSKGDPVYISGYHGSTGPVIMSKAKSNDSAKMPAFGLADDDYAENATGYAVSIGILEDVDTDSYTVGDTLYVAPTGGLTDTKPTGSNLIQNVGTVSRSNLNNGSIEVTATGRSNDVPNLTTGKLWVGSANNTIESATLHLDETNNRLGIGTTTPASPLHTYKNTSSGSNIISLETLTNKWDFRIGNSGEFLLRDGSNDRFTINGSNGNVGIGTTSSAYKLDVAGTTQINGGTGVSTTGVLVVRQDGNTLNNGIAITSSNSTSHRLWKDANGKLNIGPPSNASAFVQDLNGNIGIGTTSPNDALHLKKDTYKHLVLDRTENTNVSSLYTVGVSYSGGNEYLRLGTTGSEIMNLTDTGNVGIGTSTPSEKLHISSTSNTALKLTETSGTSTAFVEMGESDNYGVKLKWNGASNTFFHIATIDAGTETNRFNIDRYGNVGIGTTSPSQKLEVEGGDGVTAYIHSTGNSAKLDLMSDEDGAGHSGGATYLRSYGWGNSELRIGSIFMRQESGMIRFIAGGSTNVGWTSIGNFGIGTNSPGSKLHIFGADPILTIQDSETAGASSDARLRLAESGIVNSTTVIDQYWDIKKEGHNFKLSNKYGTTVYDRFTIDGSNGNATFANDVTVQGDLNVTGSFTMVDTNTQTTEQWSVTNDGTGPAVIINQKGTQPVIDIQDDSTSVFYIEDGGNVGIGATDPAYKLDVRGEVRGFNYRVDDYIRHTGDDDTYIRFVGGDDLQLVAGGRQMLRMDEGTDPDKLRFVTDNDWTNSSGNWNMSGDVTVGGDVTAQNLYLGADDQTPKIDMLFDDHASGVVWDTRIEIGKSDDFDSNTPTYVPSTNAYGMNLKANSDGVFFGMEQYNTTNFRPIISWGDDLTDSPFSIRFNNSDRLTLDKTGNLKITGGLEVEGAIFNVGTNSLVMPMVKGGHYESTSTSETGAIAITLPSGTYANATMMNFFVDVFDYAGGSDGESFTLHIGGYSYTDGTWHNTFSNLVSGRTDRFFNVRFNYDSTNSQQIIYIGETTSTWAHPKVTIRDFSAGYNGADDADWYNNSFNISFATTLLGTTSRIKNAENVASYALNADKLDDLQATQFVRSDASDTMSGDYRIESGSFASLILDREGATSGGSIVQFENNNGIIGGIGAYGSDGLQFRTSDGTQMVIDASNNVGIGTTNPHTKLTTKVSSGSFGNVTTNTDNQVRVGQYVDSSGAGRLYLYDQNNTNDVLINTNGTSHFNGGNVGIGTSNPAYKLDVTGTGQFLSDSSTQRVLYLKQNTAGTGNIIQFQGASAENVWELVGRDSNFYIYNNDLSKRAIYIEDSTNYIGLNNNTSPSHALDVFGEIRAFSDTSSKIWSENTSTGQASLELKNSEGHFRTITDGGAYYVYDQTDSAYRFYINTSGNVGIGTSTPSRKLHLVNGDFYTSEKSDSVGAAVGYGGNSFQIRNGSTSEDLNFDVYNRTSSSWYTPLIIKNTGNVGINTTTPGQKLDVNGNIRVADTIEFLRGGTEYSNYIRSQNYPSNGYTASTAKYWLEYGSKGGHHFVLDTDGGASGGNNNYDNFTIWKGVYDNTALFQVSNGGQANLTGSTHNDYRGLFRITNNSSTTTGATSTYRPALEVLNYQGNHSWGVAVQIAGGEGSNGDLPSLKFSPRLGSATETGQTTWSIGYADARTGGYKFNISEDHGLIGTSGSWGTKRFTIAPGGNVGIGTTSPSEKLDVAGTAHIGNIDIGAGTFQNRINANGDQALVINSNGSVLSLNADVSDNLILVNGGGKVGIGTTNPVYKLDVAASARVQGDLVASRLVDYGDGNYYVDPASTSNINNLTVQGNLTVNGTTTTMNTTVSTTDQWTVTNAGTDVAAIINQTGTADILDVRDNGTSVFKVKDGGDVEMKTDSKFTVGASTTANEAKIILDASNAGHPQIGLAENNDASWALGIDDNDNSFKIHGAASSTIPTIGGLATPHLELDTTGNLWLQKRIYLTSNAFIEYNSTNDSIDFFFN